MGYLKTFLFKKLVRDKTLHIFEQENVAHYNYSNLSDNNLFKALKEKLIEEAHEVAAAKDRTDLLDELADVYTILHRICQLKDLSEEDILQAMTTKNDARGAFEEGIWVEDVTVDPKKSPRLYKMYDSQPEKYPEKV